MRKTVFAAVLVVVLPLCAEAQTPKSGGELVFAVSAERRLKHPAVIAITESARRELFG